MEWTISSQETNSPILPPSLDGVILQDGIGQELPAHLVGTLPCPGRRGWVHVHLDHLADAEIGDVVQAEPGQRSLQRSAMDVEGPRLEAHEDADLSGARSPRRRYASCQ